MSPAPTGYAIRVMTLADIDAVMDIAACLPEAPHWRREAFEGSLNAEDGPRRVVFVAEDTQTSQLAGFAVASLTPPDSELESIAVTSAAQRRGVGRSLWQSLAEVLAAGGASRTFLEVRASNLRAQAFYRSLGFGEVGRRPTYYADPAEDAVILRCNPR